MFKIAVRTVSMRAAIVSLAIAFVPASCAFAAGVSPGAAQLAPSKAAPVDGTEVPALDTARSITWRRTDGTFATRIWARPVNVKNSAGTWTRIDNSLHPITGGFENGASALDVKLPSTLASPLQLSHGGDTLSLTLEGSTAAAAVDGSTATYDDAAPGVTAKLAANDAALKEDLVLGSALAQNSFTYDLKLSDGLTPKVRKDGGIDINNADGDVIYTAPAPVAADASGAVAPADATSLTVSSNGGNDWTLSLSLSSAWLSDSARSLPVTLDPSFTVDPTRDCYLSQAAATTSYCTSGELRVGRTATGSAENTALTYFDLTGAVPAGSFVQSAELDLSPLYQTSPGVSKNVSAHQITNAWDNTATWNSRTGSTAWTAAGGDYTASDLDSVALPSGSAVSPFTVTDAVSKWVAGSAPNNGIAISDDASTANNAQVYASSDWSDSSKWPSLYVEYYGRMGSMSNYTLTTQSITDKQTLGVNVAGGNLLLTDNELHVDGNRLPLDITRFYNSQDPWDGSLTNGRLSVGQDIVLYDCDSKHDRCFIGPSGFRVLFKNTGSGSFKTPSGVGDLTLTYTGSEYDLKDNATGTTYVFFDASFSFMTQLHDDDGNHIDFTYSGTGGQLSSITDTRGRTYTVTSNASGPAMGKIKTITAPNSITGDGDHTWTYGYDPTTGQLTSVTDANGKTTSYHYNSLEDIDKITDPLGHVINIGYDTSERVTSITRYVDGTPANDFTTTYSYAGDAAPCPTSSSVVGSTTVTSPAGRVTVYCWGADGGVTQAYQKYSVTPLQWRQTSTTYDATGNTSSFATNYPGTSSPFASTTTYSWSNPSVQDSTENLSSIQTAAGGKTLFGYTAGSAALRQNPSSVKTPSGNTFYYDHAATDKTLVTQVSDHPITGGTSPGANLDQTISYRSDGQISTVKDNTGATWTYGYNANGELTSIQSPTSSGIATTTFSYDGLSRLTQYKDGRTGQYVNYTYDRVGRPLTQPDSDGQNTTLVYDADGNLKTRTDPQTTSSYSYDTLNRKSAETLSGVTNGYTYDKDGNLATLTDPSGLVSYGYDTVGRLTSILSPPAAGGTAETTSFTYTDPLSATSNGNVIETLPGGGTITKQSDFDGKLTDLLVKNTAGQTKHYTWSYALAGIAGTTQPLVTSRSAQDGGTGATTNTTSYTYNIDEQLTAASTPGTGNTNYSYGYDKAGNRTTRVVTPTGGSAVTTTFAYRPGNELCYAVGGTSANACSSPPTGSIVPTYDTAGNQLTGDGNTTSWDAKGRIDGLDGNYSTILSPTNTELTGFGSGSGADTYTNTALGVGRIAAGSDLTKLVRSPQDGSAVSQIRSATKEWLVTDNIGSTIGLIDTNGNVQRTYTYDPDGTSTSLTGASGPDSWIRYAGGQLISTTGLYHFGNRFYSPVEARWTQQDPVIQPFDLQNADRYTYAGSNPINVTDLQGLQGTCADASPAACARDTKLRDENNGGLSKGEKIGCAGAAGAATTAGLIGVAAAPFTLGTSLLVGGAVGGAGAAAGAACTL